MNRYNPDPSEKKVKYLASIIYLLVLAFIVGGSYIHQQGDVSVTNNVEEEVIVIWSEPN